MSAYWHMLTRPPLDCCTCNLPTSKPVLTRRAIRSRSGLEKQIVVLGYILTCRNLKAEELPGPSQQLLPQNANPPYVPLPKPRNPPWLHHRRTRQTYPTSSFHNLILGRSFSRRTCESPSSTLELGNPSTLNRRRPKTRSVPKPY